MDLFVGIPVQAVLRRGAVRSLMAGWTVVVPTSEAEKWLRLHVPPR